MSTTLNSSDRVFAQTELARGLEFHRANRLAEARAHYELALQHSPESCDTLHLLGLVIAAQGQVEDGIALIRQAIEIQPQFARAWFSLGNLLHKQNQAEAALSAFQRSLAIKPDFEDARCNRGVLLLQLGRAAEAEEAFQEVLRANPRHASAWHNYGFSLEQLGRFQDALAAYRKAAILRPDHSDTSFGLGSLLIRMGHPTDAIPCLLRAVSLSPGSQPAWRVLAAAQHAAGHLTAATEACRRAISLAPSCVDSHLRLGHLLRAQNQQLAAQRAYLAAISLNPSCGEALNRIGLLLIEKGEVSTALDSLRRAVGHREFQPAPARSSVRVAPPRNKEVILETSHSRIALKFSIVVSSSNDGITMSAPAFFGVACADTEAKALDALASAIFQTIGDEPTSTATSILTPSVVRAPQRASAKPLISAIADEPPELLYPFVHRLDSASYLQEAYAWLQWIRGRLDTSYVNFHLGRLEAHFGNLDAGIQCQARGLTLSRRDRDDPLRLGSTEVPDYLRSPQVVEGPAELWAAWQAGVFGAKRGISPAQTPLYPTIFPASDASIARLVEIEAHNMLAEDVINHYCNFAAAMELYRRRDVLQARLFADCGMERPDTLFLGVDWVRNIGHIGYLDHLVRMRDLGLAPWRNIVLLVPANRVANRAYLNYWQQYVTVIDDPALVARFEPLVTACGFRFSTLFPFAGRQPIYTNEIGSAVEDRWESVGGAPLLTLSAADRAQGRQTLERFGIGEKDWFVCLHVRETGYHPGADQAHRNADLASYLPAIRRITDRGGWVVRLGDATMSRMPRMERVVDYPHTELKSPEMDVFLCGDCRFAIAMNSGLCHVPYSFGRPMLLANWTITGPLPPFPRRSLFLPKLIRSDSEQRLLPFAEALEPVWRDRSYSAKKLAKHAARLVDNSADEIDEAVAEMLAILDDRYSPSAEEVQRQQQFESLLRSEQPRGVSRVGTGFLRRHVDLLS